MEEGCNGQGVRDKKTKVLGRHCGGEKENKRGGEFQRLTRSFPLQPTNFDHDTTIIPPQQTKIKRKKTMMRETNSRCCREQTMRGGGKTEKKKAEERCQGRGWRGRCYKFCGCLEQDERWSRNEEESQKSQDIRAINPAERQSNLVKSRVWSVKAMDKMWQVLRRMAPFL